MLYHMLLFDVYSIFYLIDNSKSILFSVQAWTKRQCELRKVQPVERMNLMI